MVWLAQSDDPGLAAEACAVAGLLGLPLTVLPVGTARLERELERLLSPPPQRETAAAAAAGAGVGVAPP